MLLFILNWYRGESCRKIVPSEWIECSWHARGFLLQSYYVERYCDEVCSLVGHKRKKRRRMLKKKKKNYYYFNNVKKYFWRLSRALVPKSNDLITMSAVGTQWTHMFNCYDRRPKKHLRLLRNFVDRQKSTRVSASQNVVYARAFDNSLWSRSNWNLTLFCFVHQLMCVRRKLTQ